MNIHKYADALESTNDRCHDCRVMVRSTYNISVRSYHSVTTAVAVSYISVPYVHNVHMRQADSLRNGDECTILPIHAGVVRWSTPTPSEQLCSSQNEPEDAGYG